MKHTKKCNNCYQDKPVIAFYKNQAAKDELDGTCKECRNIRNKRTNTYNNPKHNPQRMYVNGKYVPKSHPLYKAGRFKTFEGAAFASLKGYETVDEGHVYVISNPCWSNWVKVGRAIDAKDRCKQYQTSSPFRDYKLCYSKYFDDRKKAEAKAHSLLKESAEERKGEWFKITQDKAKEIIETL
jgi:hypothetical protein